MATTLMTDERELVAQLVRDAQQGDQVAFGELFERFERLLRLRQVGLGFVESGLNLLLFGLVVRG